MNRILPTPTVLLTALILNLVFLTLMNTVSAEDAVVTIVEGASDAAAFSAGAGPQAQMDTDFRGYLPKTIIIKPNSTVIWYNNDTVPHSIKSGSVDKDPGALFDSGIIKEGMRWNHTFNDIGEFVYFDSIYPVMTSSVIVSENINSTNTVGDNESILEHNNLSDFTGMVKGR